jgi:hypothetical protein
MYPYYRVYIEAGCLDRESALELFEEFFISFNEPPQSKLRSILNVALV